MLNVKAFTFNPLQENTYLLSNEQKSCCIIDPGCYFPEEREALKKYIDSENLIPKYLLNTHCHLDHIFGNKYVAETWALPLHFHSLDKPVFDYGPASAQMWQLPLDHYEGEIKYIKEGESIWLDNDELQVFFTPGHSPGSVIFYHEPAGFVIGGDVLFNGSIGRTDLPGGDFDTLIKSIQTQLFVLPDDTKVYSGHGPVTTIGFEKMNNPFVKMY